MRKPGQSATAASSPVTRGLQPQRHTIMRECEIEDAAASAQEALTTATMVERASGDGLDSRAMDREMQTKAEGMKLVLEMADTLRLETMREVVALLRPPQVVHFLLAAAVLHLAVHDFRCHKDGHAPPHPAIPELVLQRADRREDPRPVRAWRAGRTGDLRGRSGASREIGERMEDDTEGGDANANLPWPSQAAEKRSPLAYFQSQARHVRLATCSQTLVHLQPTKQVKLDSREPGQGLVT